jgi:NTE family protein
MLRTVWRSIIAAALIATIISPISLHAQESGTHPKVGLVLSGGGARGAAHVGVLRVMEEMHIPIHCIVGTSMGSIVGGLYSSGVSVADLEQIAVKTDWDGLFSDKIPRQVVNYRHKTDWPNYITSLNIDFEKGIDIPQGLIEGKRLDLMLRSLTLNAPKDFNDFPIPYRAIASDIETGDFVVLSKGDLARSLRASMAIPGAFAPVEIDGKLLVDGGVANNLAVDVAKQMGADVVIAVNIGTPLSTRKDLDSFLGIIDQITNILTNKNVEARLKILGPADTLLTPEMGSVTTASFEKMGEAIEIGDKTARDSRAALDRYAVSADEYQAIRSDQLKKARPLGAIEFVKMDQESVMGSGILLNLITKRADTVLNKNVMAYNIFELYKRGDFEDIDFAVIEENGKQGLLIKTKKRERSEHVVELGLELLGSFQKDTGFRAVARYTASNLNNLGAEWKNELFMGQTSKLFTEFYQPLNPYPWHFFIAPSFTYENVPVDLYRDYTDDNAFASYRFQHVDGAFDLGLQMGEYGETRFGYVKGKTSSSLETGISVLPDEEYYTGAYKVALRIDQLDSPFFPTRGGLLSAKYLYGRENLGDDENLESIETTIIKPFTYDVHTIILRGTWDTNFDSTNSLGKGFFLGGLFNLSGLSRDQVYGNTAVLGEIIYCARVMKLSPLIGQYLYAGASFETGNAWLKRSDISTNDLIYAGSLFLGMDSNIGPIYWGFGYAEGGMSALYFSLGARQY